MAESYFSDGKCLVLILSLPLSLSYWYGLTVMSLIQPQVHGELSHIHDLAIVSPEG